MRTVEKISGKGLPPEAVAGAVFKASTVKKSKTGYIAGLFCNIDFFMVMGVQVGLDRAIRNPNDSGWKEALMDAELWMGQDRHTALIPTENSGPI